MTNYYCKREEFGPSGYSIVKSRSVQKFSQNYGDLGSKKAAYDFSSFPKYDLPPLPKPAATRLDSSSFSHSRRPSISHEKYNIDDLIPTPSLSRRNSRSEIASPITRRPSIRREKLDYEPTNYRARPFSASYTLPPPSSARGSPVRDVSRRSSLSRQLPWPEPSPIRELPPAPPRPKVKHYPLPPPSYPEGMIAVSRRLRNRSASPAPSYSELQLSSRPAIVPAALGRPSPSREMIRMTLCGPPLRQYHYGRDI